MSFGMEPRHKKILRDKLSDLMARIDFEPLAQKLLEKKVFTKPMMDDIKASGTEGECKLSLLHRLPKRGPLAFSRLLESLNETGMYDAAQLLQNAENGTATPPPVSPLNQESMDTETIPFPSDSNSGNTIGQNGDGQIQLKKASSWKIDDKTYKLTSKPRGLCLIINNNYFEGVWQEREGSEIDVGRLDQLFTNLYFKTYVRSDQSSEEMKDLIQRFARNDDHKKANCMVLIIMSHGDQDVVYGRDREPVRCEDIFQLFNNVNCEALKGKPKLFFIQACRGGKYDSGSVARESTDAGIVMTAQWRNNRMPSWSDMYIAYSTTTGYVSNKNQVTGSWFMSAFVDVVLQRAWNTHLENMMKEVCQKVQERSTHDGCRQTPEIILRGWTKKLFFHPGLYVD